MPKDVPSAAATPRTEARHRRSEPAAAAAAATHHARLGALTAGKPSVAEASARSAARPAPDSSRGEESATPPPSGAALANLVSAVGKFLLLWLVLRFLSRQTAPLSAETHTGPGVAPDTTVDVRPVARRPPSTLPTMSPLWPPGTSMTLITYVAESPVLRHFEAPDVQLVWRQPGLTYASADDAVTASVTVSVPPRVGQANGSLYAHTCLVADGGVCDPRQPGYDPQRVVYHRTLLTRWQPQRKERTKRRLMGGSADAAAKAPTAGAVAGAAAEAAPEVVAPAGSRDATVPVPASSVEPWVAYWWPHLTLHTVLIDEVNARLPPPVHPLIRPTAQRTHFMPVLVDNDFWLLQDQLQPINASTTALNLTLEFYPVSLSKYMLYQQFAQSFRMQQDMMGIEAEEIDRMKRLFVDTNPYLLGVTLLVSLLHSLLEFLAFRADVAFWRAKKDLAGISVRGMLLNLFCQTVIFLYLLDNETSWMILASQGAGLLVECWKMTRVVTATRQPTFPWVRWTHRQRPSRRVAQTMVYDAQAFRWLMYGVLPLLAGYMVYSAYSLTHTSWYGFCLSSAVTFIYAAGFLSMVPQLLINRALQSTSHMPGRTLAYKALSTFIDDLFAWVTKMPLLHRIATLRDDVIFLIWLYQRWIYPEDPRRANEYGQTGVDDDDDDDDDGGDNDNGDGEAKKDQ